MLVPSLELKHLVCSSHFLHVLESLHPIVLSFRPLFNFSPLSPVFAPGRFAGPLLAQTFLHLALFHTRAIELPGLGCSLYFVPSPGLPQNRDQTVQFSCFFCQHSFGCFGFHLTVELSHLRIWRARNGRLAPPSPALGHFDRPITWYVVAVCDVVWYCVMWQ